MTVAQREIPVGLMPELFQEPEITVWVSADYNRLQD
jgi:hypothetical protein